MQLERIPHELRALPQWVVWRAVLRGDKITKPPFRASDPSREASSLDPSTWSSFDEAVACYRANPSVVSGIGFVFSEFDPYFGIDVDDERKIAPEHLPTRKNFINQLLANVITYTEVSPSGNGLHVIGRGRMPVAGRQSNQLGVEIYGWRRFFTITGNVLDLTRTEITDQQPFIDSLGFLAPTEGDTPVGDTHAHRRMDLTDEQVVREATNHNPTFAPRFNGLAGCGPGEWSNSFMALVGMIERITGSVDQVERIIMGSPFVVAVEPSGSGETRKAKAKRIFQTVLARVRRGNDGMLPFVEHGRQIMDNIQRAKSARAAQAAEELAKAKAAIGLMSTGSASLLDAFPMLTSEHRVLTPPPGVVGEFVAATMAASFLPFDKFAIPATLSVLSGIIGRGYKLPGGSGLNLNFILAAPSASGKTQTMKVWEGFTNQARDGLPATPSGPPRNRLINSSTSSIQAMMEGFGAAPSCTWFVEECNAQLSSMSAGKTVVEASLRDAYNQLYDCSVHGSFFSGPLSVASRRANVVPINNLNVSTFWSTTTSKFDVFGEDALDGFLSRVVVVRHNKSGGKPNHGRVGALDPRLLNILRDRMAMAHQLDDAYIVSPADAGRLLTVVSTDAAEHLQRQLVELVHELTRKAIDGSLPAAYTAVSRLPLTAMRIAALIAVMESPYAPAVTEDNLRWAFGYLLQNLASLLSDMDQGEIGRGAGDDVVQVVRTMSEMIASPKYKGLPGVPKGDLITRLRERKPFSASLLSPSKASSMTIAHMLEEGFVESVTESIQTQQRGRPRTFIAPVLSASVWQNP